MASKSKTRLLRISSFDRLYGLSGGTPTNFVINFDGQVGVQNATKIFLVEWHCANLFDNLDKYRHKLYVCDDAGYEGYVELPIGQYDISELAAGLELFFNDTNMVPPYPEPLSFSAVVPGVGASEGKLEFTLAAPLTNTLSFKSQSELLVNDDIQTSLNALIGCPAYNRVEFPAGSVASVFMPFPVDLSGRKAVYLCSPDIAAFSCNDSNGTSNSVIGVMNLGDIEYGQNGSGKPAHPQSTLISYEPKRHSVKRCRIHVQDSQAQILDLPENQEVNILFKFMYGSD